jgi:hypothetical protein
MAEMVAETACEKYSKRRKRELKERIALYALEHGTYSREPFCRNLAEKGVYYTPQELNIAEMSLSQPKTNPGEPLLTFEYRGHFCDREGRVKRNHKEVFDSIKRKRNRIKYLRSFVG